MSIVQRIDFILNEGNKPKLKKLLNQKEIKQLKQCIDGNKDLMVDFEDLYEKLFNHYSDEMPYGIQKAREGDPDQWILDRLEKEL